ncbi:MAG: Na+/H+ antiporter NhaC family protein, partial [Abditibacteriota bacterium]|nr:Na+/H+ antiporter NhaC family protein [Abditibacteriota bacterium]
MDGTFWAILPALIAIFLALLTKEVYSSLFCGIVVGALLANGFNPVESFNTIAIKGLSEPVADLAGISIFLVILG